MDSLGKFYKNKNVFVTGHTGFKGSWLCSVLLKFGAKITGYSLNDMKKNYYKNFLDYKKINNIYGDILDFNKLKKNILINQPQIIFHLAAQSLVKTSYKFPYKTIEINLLGSTNIMEIANEYKKLKALVLVTSDKCYKNIEISRGYKETDILGGNDPYSASKAATEIIFNSYLKSFFFKKKSCGFATARAGNVIGGGDWSEDRVVPDVIRAIKNNKNIILRNPNSTRPWQHVLEPVSGYLLLGKKIYENPSLYSGSWNFGPRSNEIMKVKDVVSFLINNLVYKKVKIIIKKNKFYEAKLLKLNTKKTNIKLGWQSRWSMKKAIIMTADWYKNYIKIQDIKKTTVEQIKEFFKIN
jgi:CDP-glucose 4,6-dehydratase